MKGSCEKEIRRLHDFFVGWFTGKLANEESIFGEQCVCVFSPDMTMIPPSGAAMNRSKLIEQLRSSHGCHQDKDVFTIEIKNFTVIQDCEDSCLLSYQEWQQIDDSVTARVSTALFRKSTWSTTPHGVEWVHLQETWIEATKQVFDSPLSLSPPRTPDSTLSAGKKQDPPSPTSTTPPRPTLSRDPSLVSKRRHLYPNLDKEFEEVETVQNSIGEIAGITLEGWKITTQQGSIADDAWLSQATERLMEVAQPRKSNLVQHSDEHDLHLRRLNLPEMVFSHAHVSLVNEERQLKVTFGAYAALREWAQAHKEIPLQSDIAYRGVSVLQSIDAALWQQKRHHHVSTSSDSAMQASNFHYDWTFSTPHASNTTMDVSWHPLEQSGMKQSLLKDQSIPILLFDDVLLYEDDLHDNGEVTLSVRVRVMPTCVFCLERLWLRVDGVLLRLRETRVMLEFGGKQKAEDVIYRDVSWRECPWGQLEEHGLPTDVRSWCVPADGTPEAQAFQELLRKLPSVPLPDDLPQFSMLKE